MNSKLLQLIGLVAILACVGASFAALAVVKQRIHVTVQSDAEAAQRGPDPSELLRADVSELRGDLAALSEGIGEQLGQLHQALTEAAEQRERGLQGRLEDARRQLAALQGEVETLTRQTTGLREQLGSLSAQPEPAPPAAQAEELAALAEPAERDVAAVAEPEAGPQRSFLSFKLPSQSFSFAGKQRLAIVPSLSRIGFDAQSTLHDFSGVTQRIEGELVVDLARPEQGCSGELRADSKSLDTGLADRDEEMRKRLEVERHPTLRFQWTSFAPSAVDGEALTVAGVAKGLLTIRGVAREVSMPVRVSVDASKRVAIEGEMKLAMSAFGIEPPSQLGVINVEDEVKLWVALCARPMGAVKERDGGL